MKHSTRSFTFYINLTANDYEQKLPTLNFKNVLFNSAYLQFGVILHRLPKPYLSLSLRKRPIHLPK